VRLALFFNSTKKVLRGLSHRREVSFTEKAPASLKRYALAAAEAVHPACPHLQAISGVFSIASHCVLQYLPDVTVHEQTGCAHFLLSAIFSLLRSPGPPLLQRTATLVGHQVNGVYRGHPGPAL
jgi:hypothetical protein